MIEMPESEQNALCPLCDFRRDPQAHPLKTDSGKIEIYSARIAGFGMPTARRIQCGWSRTNGTATPRPSSSGAFRSSGAPSAQPA
jgi:hypothetical protein